MRKFMIPKLLVCILAWAFLLASCPAPSYARILSFDELIPLLPPYDGWIMGEPDGQTLDGKDGPVSMLSVTYTKEASSFAITIFVGSGDVESPGAGLLAPGVKRIDTTDGYAELTAIGGFPAWISVSDSNKTTEVWIQVTGKAWLSFSGIGEDKKKFRRMVAKFSCKKLKGKIE